MSKRHTRASPARLPVPRDSGRFARMTVPFVCVFLAAILVYVPRVFVLIAQTRMPEGLDNKDPRGQQTRLTGWGKRAQGAHLNAFEAFAPFAAAVFVSHLGGANPQRAAWLAIAFVG